MPIKSGALPVPQNSAWSEMCDTPRTGVLFILHSNGRRLMSSCTMTGLQVYGAHGKRTQAASSTLLVGRRVSALGNIDRLESLPGA